MSSTAATTISTSPRMTMHAHSSSKNRQRVTAQNNNKNLRPAPIDDARLQLGQKLYVLHTAVVCWRMEVLLGKRCQFEHENNQVHAESQGSGSSKNNPVPTTSHPFLGAPAALASVVGPRPDHRKRRTKHDKRAVRSESCSETPWARDDRFVGPSHGHLVARRHVSRPFRREVI